MWDSHVVVTCEGLAAFYANYSRLIFVNYWGRFASKWLSWYFCILKHQCDLYKDKPSIITDVSHVCTNLNRFHCWHLVCTKVQTHDATWMSFLLFYYYYFFPKMTQLNVEVQYGYIFYYFVIIIFSLKWHSWMSLLESGVPT